MKAKIFTLQHMQKWLPTSGNILFTLLIAALILYTQRADALPGGSVPQASSSTNTTTIPYQGRLTDSNGNPVNTTQAMTFRLYNVASGGTALWQESWPAVQVNNGLFNVLLGNTVSIPQNVITENDSLWLGVRVGTDIEMIPRVQMGSVPFARQSLTVPDGAITTDMLTIDAVTQIQAVTGAVVDSTSSTSFVDMPGRTITMTTTGGPVLVMFSGSFVAIDTILVGYWQIMRDDNVQPFAHNNQHFPANEWQTISLWGLDEPPAGEHTYTLQWRVNTGTLIASEGIYSENFGVLELKK